MSRKPQQEEPTGISPPSAPEAEQSVLGAILLRPSMMDEVADILNPPDFYREAHRKIFRAMLEIYLRQEPVDFVTLHNLLKERGQLEEVGGLLYLSGLSEHVGIAANADHYAKIVRDKATLRRVLAASQDIAGACLAPVEDVPEFLEWAEEQIYLTKEDQDAQEVFLLDDLLPIEQQRIEQNFERKREILGLPSGFIDLDHLTGGWQPGDLVIIAGRPSMGKTAMGGNIAYHAAKICGVPTLLFSLEQPKEQLTQRFMAAVGKINATHMRAGKMEKPEWDNFYEVIEHGLADTPIYIIDKPALNLLEIRSQTRRLKSREGIGLVVLDYLQLARDPKAKSEEQRVAAISQGLKALAKEMSLPVIALCQLNRKVEERPNKRPILADLRGSGSIEQDADVIIFIYRDEVYREDSKDQGLAEVRLAKQRNGPTGKIKLAYLAEYMRFENYIADQPAEAGFF
jgi:replicative DNA helicase